MASMRSIIQREIMAVKHAIANGIPHEGVAHPDLDGILLDLQAHRAEVIAGENGAPQTPARPPARPKAKPIAKTPPLLVSREAIAHNKSAKKQKHNSVGSPGQGKAAGSAETHDQAATKKKQAKTSNIDFLRQLRRSIRVGDAVSVLMDVRLMDGWVRSWVRGEVIREMNRSGRFQIAFDHDKDGLGSASRGSSSVIGGGVGGGVCKVKPEIHEDNIIEDTRWIHEQRLEIDHPHFFCGNGSNPPHGVDDSRVRGAWYLHAKKAESVSEETDAQYEASSNDRLCV